MLMMNVGMVRGLNQKVGMGRDLILIHHPEGWDADADDESEGWEGATAFVGQKPAGVGRCQGAGTSVGQAPRCGGRGRGRVVRPALGGGGKVVLGAATPVGQAPGAGGKIRGAPGAGGRRVGGAATPVGPAPGGGGRGRGKVAVLGPVGQWAQPLGEEGRIEGRL